MLLIKKKFCRRHSETDKDRKRHLETERAISGHSETLSDISGRLIQKKQARNIKGGKKTKDHTKKKIFPHRTHSARKVFHRHLLRIKSALPLF